MNIAINGFGRIGRAAFKIISKREDMRVVAINDLTDAATLAHLLRFDTAYGRYEHAVSAREGYLIVDAHEYPVIAEPDPAKLPWKEYEVDVVLECTGRFVADGRAAAHLEAGARRVVISAPAKGKGNVSTRVMGVNHTEETDSPVVSNASCTTNCLGPIMEVLNRTFGVRKSLMSTIHSYTANQNLQDGPHKDLRRARAAAANIVPTSTGAAIATTKVIPELEGLMDGIAVRVPTITVSLVDLTVLTENSVSVKEVNKAFVEAAESDRYKGIIGVTEEPLVSSDFIGETCSAVVDLSLTRVVDGDLVKVIAWYDNEWGYANRLVDLAATIGV